MQDPVTAAHPAQRSVSPDVDLLLFWQDGKLWVCSPRPRRPDAVSCLDPKLHRRRVQLQISIGRRYMAYLYLVTLPIRC
jgi:hypothetical protein